MPYSRPLLLIYFIYSSVYLLIPNSQFVPSHLYPLITISLPSISVSHFLFCKKKCICIIFLDSTYRRYHMTFVFFYKPNIGFHRWLTW